MGVAHPTVRRHLDELEATLGSPLFVRSPSGLLPTELARDLQAEAFEQLGIAEIPGTGLLAVTVPGAFTTAAITLGVLITLLLGVAPALALSWAGSGSFVS